MLIKYFITEKITRLIIRSIYNNSYSCTTADVIEAINPPSHGFLYVLLLCQSIVADLIRWYLQGMDTPAYCGD